MDDDKNNLFCLCWGALFEHQYVHPSCDVIVRSVDQIADKKHIPLQLPAVCECECQTCKRAWWAQGRPIIREEDGVLRRDFDK